MASERISQLAKLRSIAGTRLCDNPELAVVAERLDGKETYIVDQEFREVIRPPNRRDGCSRIIFDPGMVRTTRVTPRRVIRYLLMANPVRIPPSLSMSRVFTEATLGSLA